MTTDPFQTILEQAQAHFRAGRYHESELLCRKVLAKVPAHPDAQFGLSILALEARKPEHAQEHILIALQSNPNHTPYLNQLALIYSFTGLISHAEQLLVRTLLLAPQAAQTHYNLGIVFMQTHRLAQAVDSFERALTLKPDFADAHSCLGKALVMLGDQTRGWRELEWRWKTHLGQLHASPHNQPMWDGSPLAGRKLMVFAEQGYGDMFQFVRFLPQLTRAGHEVVFLCPPELKSLFRQASEMGRIVATDETLPDFDVQCPLMSLPLHLGTTLQSIPVEMPYLKAEPKAVELWLSQRRPGLNVGLVWAGRPTHKHDHERSIILAQFAPLAQIEGVHFISLQKGPREHEPLPDGMTLTRVGDRLHDFSDTAAVIESLDLLITVDTAVAHLAGALNKPVWMMLQYAPDWRWMLDRADSPWYPTMRLYRQPAHREWGPVIARLAQDLEVLTGGN